ncbi:MAG: hypothetical protein R8P61_16925 [Bacteroidia bacterium]|nr:hypothetical protein [Bacteroidia bacterium]
MKPILLILSINIFLGSLIPNLDFSQFYRLAQVRHHYLEHIEEGKAESDDFLEFIWLHFINTQEHQEPNHEDDHKKLPLNSLDLSQSLTLFFVIPNKSFQASTVFPYKEFEPYYLLPKGFPSMVFHPPI